MYFMGPYGINFHNIQLRKSLELVGQFWPRFQKTFIICDGKNDELYILPTCCRKPEAQMAVDEKTDRKADP